ncbi:MAG: L,D-transpeptidase [Pseudomonadota bacterium]|nr:L,D-transpeptidase [Pseudomonadota bacterium]
MDQKGFSAVGSLFSDRLLSRASAIQVSAIVVEVGSQTLSAYDAEGGLWRRYAVSTGANGVGEQYGSECTPRGRHIVRARIGGGQPENAIFVSRRPTGEIFRPALRQTHPGRDWILTRILWLSGLERGRNRLGVVDTMRRYIYIHGAPDDVPMGAPGSHGCVRMRNRDIAELFDAVATGTPVEIRE